MSTEAKESLAEAVETLQLWTDQWADEQAELDEVSQCDEEERKVIRATRTVLKAIFATFPNPLMIQMGEGRILFSKFWDKDDRDGGVILSDSGEPHEVGSESDQSPESDYVPRQGEVFLRFGRKESAEALRDVINEVIEAWPTPAADTE